MMMTLWAIASVLVAAALWFVIPMLPASRRGIDPARYRDQLAALEADRVRGALGAEQFEQARADLERRVLQDLLADQSRTTPAAGAGARWLLPGLALALPLSAIAFYLGQHFRDASLEGAVATAPARAAARPAGDTPAVAHLAAKDPLGGPHGKATDETQGMPMEDAIARLKKRLEEHPEDGDGWLLLGNSYRFLGKTDEAKGAFDKAVALGKRVPPAGKAPAPGAAAIDAPADLGALKKQVEANPDDGASWVRLGRLHQQQQRLEDAVAAFDRAVAIDGRNADWLADAADAKATVAKSLEGEPSKLIERALAVNPKHVKALWLAASAATARGDGAAAIELWTRLRDVLPPGSAEQEIVAANLAEAKGEKPPAADVATAVTVKGSIALDSSLAADVKGDETVFIFARAASGPQMPLAVLRKQARDLPLEFTLDDTMAIMPAAKLSTVHEVVVVARISKTGNATSQPGDLEGVSGTIAVGDDKPVHVVIDRRT